MQQALFFSVLHKPLTDVEGLGDHGGGGAALVLPGGGQDAGELVVPELHVKDTDIAFLM